jgi:transposase-like protein
MLHKEEELQEILNAFNTFILTRGCLKCGEFIELYSERMVKCSNKLCKYRYSMYKNTCFYSCKVSPITFLKVIDLYLNFVPYELISNLSTISRNRVTDMIYKFNHETVFLNYLRHIKLGGTGNIIEIDESKFGKRKYNKGYRVDGVWLR